MVKYLRELSVVVAGIAITFTASDWISDRNEKKDLGRYLDAVKLELEENLEIVKEKKEFYHRSAQFGEYLRSQKKPKDADSDSLKKYNDVSSYIFFMTYKTSAFDMLKMSGAMRLIKDKTLMNSILNSYRMLEEAKYDSDMYINRKVDEIFRTALDNEEISHDIRLPQNRRLYSFYTIHFDIEEVFKDCDIQLSKTISLFPDKN